MIQNLKGGGSDAAKEMRTKFNKALGFNGKKGKRAHASKRDARRKEGAAFLQDNPQRSGGGGGGAMGLMNKIVDKNTGGLSEFGQNLRNNAPSVLAAKRRLAESKLKRYLDDPLLKAKSLARRNESDEEDSESDSDFGDDKELAAIRSKRIKELKKRSAVNQEWARLGHGAYSEIHQDDFLTCVTKSKYAIVHFYHTDFERCKIVDKHLSILARKHPSAKFAKINAAKCPFFVGKLKIKVLPSIILFTEGVAKDRLTGFEELGNTDEFPTALLECRLAVSGVIPPPVKLKKKVAIGGIRDREEDSDSDIGF